MTIEFAEPQQTATDGADAALNRMAPEQNVSPASGAVPHSGKPVIISPSVVHLVTQHLRRHGFRRVLHDKLRLGSPCVENSGHNIVLGTPPRVYSIQPASAERCNLCIHAARRPPSAAPVQPNAAAGGLMPELVAAVLAGDIQIANVERYPELHTVIIVAGLARGADHGA